MQSGTAIDGNGLCFSQACIAIKLFLRYHCVTYQFLALVFLVFYLAACDSSVACDSTSLNQSRPAVATPTSVQSTPPLPPPSTPSPAPSPTDTPLPLATPTPQIPETPKEEARQFALRYIKLAIARKLLKLYNLLSNDLRSSIDYEQFSHDPNYVLSDSPACWHENDSDMILSSPDGGQTWDIGMPMTQVSCTDGSTMATYDWHLRVLIPQDGPPVVIRAGLYPTGN